MFETLIRVARLAIFRPNFKNMDWFQVGRPKRICLPFGLFFSFTSSWLALKNLCGLLVHFWPFYAKIGSYEGQYYYSIFSPTYCKIFVTNAISDAHIVILVIFEAELLPQSFQ